MDKFNLLYESVMQRLVKESLDDPEEIRKRLEHAKYISSDFYWDAIDEKIKLASCKNAPSDVLEELAKDEEFEVRRAVASNSSTPVDVLKSLSTDEDRDVRQRVAYNDSCSAEILDKLSTDEMDDIRVAVAGNRNTSTETLKTLVDDTNESIRKHAEENLRERDKNV